MSEDVDISPTDMSVRYLQQNQSISFATEKFVLNILIRAQSFQLAFWSPVLKQTAKRARYLRKAWFYQRPTETVRRKATGGNRQARIGCYFLIYSDICIQWNTIW